MTQEQIIQAHLQAATNRAYVLGAILGLALGFAIGALLWP